MKAKLFLIDIFVILNSKLIISQNFFPLAVGNKWQFKVTEWDPSVPYSSIDTTIIKVIKDTTLPNNITYFVLDGYFPLGGMLRSDSIGVYYHDSRDSSDCIVYNYNSKLYQPYKTGFQAGGDSAIVTLEQIDSSEIFLRKVKTLSFSYNWMIGHIITFGEEIGPVYFSTGGDGTTLRVDYELIGYMINDKTFGNITSSRNSNIKLNNYTLYQNYPNPFNPTTTIKYEVPKSSFVTIKVFNILGKEVATLVNENESTGIYSVQFNASVLSSGVYFYIMRVGDFVSTKKLVLLK